MKKILSASIYFLLGIGSALSFGASAAAPDGYYNLCENKSGTTLLSAIHSTVSNHTNVGYDGLWKVYYTSDVRPNGTLWDMYSTKEWVPGQKQCGNYSLVGDCYNREHSLPKSWFKEASPMVSDAFHIYPTDGKVNGQRSNYPYGECAAGTSLPANGSVKPLGRLGKSSYPGYSGTVFEPDDQYKGDFARTYFYMAACYYDKIAGWNSDMLSGDKDNPFKAWAMEMLLKWHRQDPVSDKETKRNDAVYEYQHNRNPFIDHPEFAEYLWGDKKGQKWATGTPLETIIHQPQTGTEIDLGISRPGVVVERTISILTSNATENVAVSVIGGAFSVTPRSITAASANEGADVTLRYNPSTTGDHAATLRVTCGEATSTVTIRGRAIDGLPAGPVTNITDQSFTAVWTYVGGEDEDGNYTLTVSDDQGTLDGYPKAVKASEGSYEVTGLSPATTYTYSVANSLLKSADVKVTTATDLPSINFLFDGTLIFRTTPGEPSEIAELVIDIDNVDGDFKVEVDEPFQISVDKDEWHTSITLSPDNDRIYMRLYTKTAGEYTTSIRAMFDDYMTDDATVIGIVTVDTDFLEDFEKGEKTSYNDGNYEGTACSWYFHNAGIWKADQAANGEYAVRFGKEATSYIAMNTDLTHGVGTVKFNARPWAADGDATLVVETSTDGGQTYEPAGETNLTGDAYTEHSVFAGVSGKARVRIRQTAGKRLLIDDVAITPHTSGCEYLDADYHAWDAFCRGGRLVVEVTRNTGTFFIYALDGTAVAETPLVTGFHNFDVAPGLYIVVCGDDARRVVVR